MVDARSNETFVSPSSGEWVAVLEPAAATGGEHVTLELKAPPGVVALPGLVRQEQAQVLEVLGGTLAVELDGEDVEALRGDVVVVPADRPRRWWNAGTEELHLRVHVRPALGLEDELRQSFVSLSDGGAPVLSAA